MKLHDEVTLMGDDVAVAVLVRRLAEQSVTLARQELKLADLELREIVAGLGAGITGAAGIAVAVGFLALLAAIGAVITVAGAGLETLLENLRQWSTAGPVGQAR